MFVNNNVGRDQAMETFLAPVASMGMTLLPRCYNGSQVDPYLGNGECKSNVTQCKAI